MPVNSVSFVRDTTLLMRDIISGAIPDPVADRQRQSRDTHSGAAFVMTSWPERPVVYPCITITDVSTTDNSLGVQTEDSLSRMQLQVDVWTKQVGQRDGIAGSVYYGLRTAQLGASSFVGSGLFDFRLVNSRNLDEQGKGGLHRKSMTIEFSYIHTP